MTRRKSLKKRRKAPIALIVIGMVLIIGLLIPKLVNWFQPCANSISCIKDLSGSFQPGKTSTFLGQIVPQPTYLGEEPIKSPVLGTTTEEKHIYVDLTNQKLMAYEGEKLVLSFPISSGKWGQTPTGDFRIWVKLRYAHMEGGDPARSTYYNLYNVPYTMYFAGSTVPKTRGFALHGAFWHNNFGYPMSHGCVNIRPADAKKLFDWADPPTETKTTYASVTNPGTLLTIYGQIPSE